jgi:hypothetical protein
MEGDQKVHVFQMASSYLTLHEALQLLSLNKYFHDHLPNSLYKRIIVEHSLATIFYNESEGVISTDQICKMIGWEDKSYDLVYESIKSAQNLVKNPYGAEGFENWSRFDGGDGWAIQNWGTYKDKSTAFVSSYLWGKLVQNIQLPSFSHRLVLAKAMIARRWDCGALGQIIIKFDNGTKFKSETVECPLDSRDTEEGICHAWIPLIIRVKVPDDVKSVDLILKGKDMDFWSGHYGARFGMTSLRVFKSSS